MDINLAQPVTAQDVTARKPIVERDDFRRLVSQAATAQDVDQQMREVAEQFVSGAFLQPLLKQMQDDPFRSDLMHGGFAEDSFQSQLNTIIADRIAAKPDFPIVDALHKHIMNVYVNRGAQPRQVEMHG